MTCGACGAANSERAKFCIDCGAALALACPSCGAPHAGGQRFCAECGGALPGAAPAGPDGERAPVTGAVNPAEPELRFVSVLFVDLVGFTTLSEGRAAEDVRELLSGYFDVARGVVERYGGRIEKFIGDAVMAVWGAPVTHEDDAERAVRAALEIVAAVSEFGATVGAPDLQARAGVVTGQAAAVESEAEGIVVGDRVNTASRVQSAAQPGTVLVDEVTSRVASAAILFEDAGEHTVKGKAEPLHLFRAVRVVAGVRGREREQLLEAPFVGRDRELRLVKELLEATVERGGARLVAITGAAGIGKSRLRREFSNYTDGLAQAFLWHTGRCLAHGDGVAYWALAEIVRQRLGIAEDAPTGEAVAKLDTGLLEWIVDPEEREYIRPRLGPLIGTGSPGLDRAELFAGWRLFLERLATHDPVVLIFEDMQWADDGLLAFIDQLLDWSRTVPIFMLALARPELAAEHDGWPAGRRGVTAIDLEPLTDAASGELLDGMVERLPADVRERIVARAQGNPLYAVETIRSLADRGALERVDGRLVAAGEVGELETPESLSALLASRLDALDPAERELVKAVSVFGGSFPLEAVVALTATDPGEVEALLASLVRKQVFVIKSDPLSPDRGQYTFAQGLLRSVAYDTLARRARKQLHLRAVDHLRSAFANDGEDVAEVIATHVLDAYGATSPDEPDHDELRAAAVAALSRSADRAESVGAQAVGAQALRRAAELADEYERPTLLERASRMARTAGRYQEALELADAAAELFAAQGRERERALAVDATAGPLVSLGRAQEARQRLEAALGAFAGPEILDSGRVKLMERLGSVLRVLGEYARAEPLLIEVCAAAEALELYDQLASALDGRALICTLSGRPQEAVALYRLAIDLAERHGFPYTAIRASANLGVALSIWCLPGAREQQERDLANVRRLGHAFSEAASAHNVMEQYVNEGLWDTAEQLGQEARERVPDPYTDAMIGYQLVRLDALRGDADRAATSLRLLAALDGEDDLWVQVMYDTAELFAGAARGDATLVLQRGLEVADVAAAKLGEETETPNLQAWPHMLDGALTLGELRSAERVIEILAARPSGHLTPGLRAHLARGRALLAVARDDDGDAAESDLRNAIDRFRQINWVYWHAVGELDLADLLLRQGRGGEAATLLDHAISVLEPLRATPALDRARALTQRTADVQASA